MRFNKPSRKIRIKKKKYKQSKKEQSATFLMLLFAGGVLLALFYFVLFQKHDEHLADARQEKIQADMDKICFSALLYFQNHGNYPMTIKDMGMPSDNSTIPKEKALEGTAASEFPRMPLDPWKNRYTYQYILEDDMIILTCWGADMKPGGTGESADIIRRGCPPSSFPPQ